MAMTEMGGDGVTVITVQQYNDIYDLIGGITAGTQVASKAVIADANINIGVTKVTELHIGTSGSETQVTATAAELNYLDITAAGTAQASKAVVLDASKNIATLGTVGCGAVTSTGASSFGSIALTGSGGAAAANMLLMGRGTTADPATTAVADKSFVEFRTQSTATSGDSRGLYWRHELNGAGNSGESIRAFTKVKLAAANARGAHVSLDLDATGSVTGLGVGVDAQLSVGNAALSAGTYAIINAEMYAGGSSTDITGTTQTSVMRVTFGGDATGKGKFNDAAFFLDLTGVAAASGDFIDTDKTAITGYGSMRVKCPDGATRYIPITTGS